MNLAGKKCGFCLNGKMHRIQDEIERGIFVEAFECGNCKEKAYSRHVMERMDALFRESSESRSLIKVGASLALSIPSSIVKKLRLKPKEKVYVTSKGNEIIARVPNV